MRFFDTVQLDVQLTADPGVTSWNPSLACITFVKINHEIICTIILTLLLIQEGQMSVTGEIMCTCTG